MRYREFTVNLAGRKGKMVSEAALPLLPTVFPDTGYCSVYSFNKQDSERIKLSGSSRLLKTATPGASELWIDIDKGSGALDKVLEALNSIRVKYDLFSSGGKGYHIRLEHDFIEDSRLPFSHKQWVIDNIPGSSDLVDLTLYNVSRLLSNVGRVHPKTGLKKVYICSVLGDKIIVVLQDPKTGLFDKLEGGVFDGSIVAALDYISSIGQNPPAEGRRHMTFWKAASRLLETGLAPQTTFDLLTKVNELCQNPLETEELENLVTRESKKKKTISQNDLDQLCDDFGCGTVYLGNKPSTKPESPEGATNAPLVCR